MGKLFGGPFYLLRGRTGNNVGRYLKGQNVFAMRPVKSAKLATKKQVDQQTVFAFATSFLSQFRKFTNLGFRSNKRSQSPMNAAVAYNLKHAIKGNMPDIEINYEKLLFNRGTLADAKDPKAEGAVGKVNFSWTNLNINADDPLLEDKAIFIILDILNRRYATVGIVVPRSRMSYTLPVPGAFMGRDCACFMSFVSASSKNVSSTQYCGTVKIL